MKIKRSLKLKLKKLLFLLPIFIVVFSFIVLPVSAASSVTIGNFTFSNPSFRTYVNDYGYQEPTEEDNLWVEYYELTDGVLQWVLDKDEGDIFGAGSDKYRCMEGKITFPYSDYNRVFTFIVTPTFSWNGDIYHESNFDLSLGEHTYFYSNGSKLDYTAERLDSNKSVVFTINVKNYDSIDFQVSSLCYLGWENYSLIFSHFQLEANPNKDIIDNQDKNASEIMQNQNENTDEILNGWDTDASPDENTTDDYSDIEQSLIDDTQDNADNANVEVTDNFVGSLQRYVSGFGAVSQMFSDLLLVQVPDVNGIVWFSLAMGVVPLIVGSAIGGLRSRDRAAARARSQNDYKRGYNAGYTKGKGG